MAENQFVTMTTTSAASLAIFQINYYRDTDIAYAKSKGWDGKNEWVDAPEAHAIVLVLGDQGDVFIEPQSGPIELSEDEIKSIFFVLG